MASFELRDQDLTGQFILYQSLKDPTMMALIRCDRFLGTRRLGLSALLGLAALNLTTKGELP